MDKISIIVCIYNVEQYLKRCIASICGQSYHNLEIILVDDASEDDSVLVCRRFEQADSRIKLLHHEVNLGLSVARNTALDKATGQYIMFVDGDDSVAPDYCETLLQTMKENAADVVLCNFTEVDKREISAITHLEAWKHLKEGITYSGRDMLQQYYRSNDFKSIVVMWNKIYRKELFNEIRFPKGRIHEDNSVMPEILYRTKQIVCVDRALYFYTIRADSIMNSERLKGQRRRDRHAAYEQNLSFFERMKDRKFYQVVMRKYINAIANEIAAETESEGFTYLKSKIIQVYKSYHKRMKLSVRLDCFMMLKIGSPYLRFKTCIRNNMKKMGISQ